MNKTVMIMILALLSMGKLSAQTQEEALIKNAAFQGAIAEKKSYHAIYQLDSNDPKTIEKAIRNINNALDDPRLKGKLHIELIAFSGGTEAFLKSTSKFEEPFKKLIKRGVLVAQCLNSLKERNLTKEELFDFIGYVPSGNGELIIRAHQGWNIVKP
ncbi:DsrE family protein [Sphingobacterium sp. SRCM116780]|uniref:DsrE family protein n=1 Tax=Sphingobacterium sp. SRCM116780 TaxID=2907623 RepID=UPI001F4788B8|nr:DsrE family protein [Sphingobacterium sp. SRCM116780]UIR56321.1 DsrE family protein [Sphingobacterium sp. SRCM116780]